MTHKSDYIEQICQNALTLCIFMKITTFIDILPHQNKGINKRRYKFDILMDYHPIFVYYVP